MDSPEAELSILIVDDAEIATLNQEYLNRQGPTNVIAFPMRAGDFPQITPQLLGDVVISVETTERERLAAGLEFRERLDQLLVHGILHLFGYDHVDSAEEARRMEAKSAELTEMIRPI